MRRADVGNVAARLCPRRSVGGVGVDNAAYLREAAVELQMCRGVGRRIEVALDNLPALQVDNNHVRSLHIVVINAGGFDNNQFPFAVDA